MQNSPTSAATSLKSVPANAPRAELANTSPADELRRASRSQDVVVADLRAALAKASAVEAIVLYGMIDAATDLKRRIDQLAEAVEG